VARHGRLGATQDETRSVLRLLRERGFCRHLEIETYTWEVLPQALRMDLVEFLKEESRWTLKALGLPNP